jgi:hemerythrin-like domain-containing protein
MVDSNLIWHYEHVRFGQLLNMLEAQASAFHRGIQPNYELMRDIVYYLRAYGDHVHHPREDVAFEMLATRAPELAATIQGLRQQHQEIAVKSEDLHRHLDQIIDDVIVPRVELEKSVADFLALYRTHIATEERDVMPTAQRVLKSEDWSASAAKVPGQADPLFGENVLAPFRALRAHIDREAAAPLG